MKAYDYQKAKRLIEGEHGNGLKEASLGMWEDWFWTAEPVWEDGAFRVSLDDPELILGGINKSVWATPALCLEYEDGTERLFPCWMDDGEQVSPEDEARGRRVASMGMGVLSGPAQGRLPPMEDDPEAG